MKYKSGWALVALLCLLCFLIGNGALWGESLRIATYNLGNYNETGRTVDDRWLPDYPKPEAEKRALRRVILTARPDVLAIQEIGSPEFLEELRLDLQAQGLDFSHSAHMTAVDGTRNTAVLSRIPFRFVARHHDLNFKYFEKRERVKRGLMEIELAIGEESLDSLLLFVVHLKSRLSRDAKDTESKKRRIGEAQACRNYIVERTIKKGHTYYCIAGDFNDHPDSSTLQRFCKRGDLRIGHRLQAYDERGEVWTHFLARKGLYSTLDGFVVSPALMPKIKAGKGWIMGDLEGSDHRMVYFDIDLMQ